MSFAWSGGNARASPSCASGIWVQFKGCIKTDATLDPKDPNIIKWTARNKASDEKRTHVKPELRRGFSEVIKRGVDL